MKQEQYETQRKRLVDVIHIALYHKLPHVLRARRRDLMSLNEAHPQYAKSHSSDDDFLLTADPTNYRDTEYCKNILRMQNILREEESCSKNPFADKFCKDCANCVQRGCVNLCYCFDPPREVNPLTPVSECPFN